MYNESRPYKCQYCDFVAYTTAEIVGPIKHINCKNAPRTSFFYLNRTVDQKRLAGEPNWFHSIIIWIKNYFGVK